MISGTCAGFVLGIFCAYRIADCDIMRRKERTMSNAIAELVTRRARTGADPQRTMRMAAALFALQTRANLNRTTHSVRTQGTVWDGLTDAQIVAVCRGER
jgi:hypothetical protein